MMDSRIWIEKMEGSGLHYRAEKNRLGLMYLAGASQSRTLAEPDPGPNGFGATRREIISRYLREYSHVRLLYPYPSPEEFELIYTDEYLPGTHDLKHNGRGESFFRFQMFDEPSAWQTVIREGLFAELSNGFIVEYGSAPVWPRLVFQKLPVNRGPGYSLSTLIYEDQDGSRSVRKQAMNERAVDHLREIPENYSRLKKVYEGCALRINACTFIGEYVELEFETGRTLTSILDERIECGDIQGFYSLIEEMKEKLQEPGLNERGRLSFCSTDVIFDNFIIDDDHWTLIDYEWAGEDVDPKYILYRSLKLYFLDCHLRGDHSAAYNEAKARFGITEDLEREYDEIEEAFQAGIRGEEEPAPELLAVPYIKMAELASEGAVLREPECYFGQGRGFSPQDRAAVDTEAGADGRKKIRISFSPGQKEIRFDPAEMPGVLTLHGAYDDQGRALKPKKTNAAKRKKNSYYFTSADPQVVFPVKRDAGEIYVSYSFAVFSESAAAALKQVL